MLFGAHQFLIHPVMLALAWSKLYGWPKDLRLWVCFLVHDIGYWRVTTIDGKDGRLHPKEGARLVGQLFGPEWETFCVLHSREYAHLLGLRPSRLCAADKLATALEPEWLYLPRIMLSGEYREYLVQYPAVERHHERGETVQHARPREGIAQLRFWYVVMQRSLRTWVRANAPTLAHEPKRQDA